MNCPTCGASVKAGAEFCDNCGARLHTAQHVSESPQYSNNPFTGFSRMVDSEEVLAAIRKQKRITLFAWIGLVLVVLIGFLAFGAISSSMEIVQALAYGVVIDVIIIIAMLILTLRKALSKPFEGTVEQKRTSIRLGNGRRRSRRRM